MELQEVIKKVQECKYYGLGTRLMSKGYKKNSINVVLKHGVVRTALHKRILIDAHDILIAHEKEFNRV
jgi:hypothetical protein